MKTVDARMTEEEKATLASLIGKRFDECQCDEFHFNPSVYQMVAIYVDSIPYLIENASRPLDYQPVPRLLWGGGRLSPHDKEGRARCRCFSNS